MPFYFLSGTGNETKISFGEKYNNFTPIHFASVTKNYMITFFKALMDIQSARNYSCLIL